MSSTQIEDWVDVLGRASGWDLSFAYTVSLLSWLHLLLPVGMVLGGALIIYAGLWMNSYSLKALEVLLLPLRNSGVAKAMLAYRRAVRELIRIQRQIQGQVRDRYLGLLTLLTHRGELLDTLRERSGLLCTRCRLRYLESLLSNGGTLGLRATCNCMCSDCKWYFMLTLVSWQEAVGLLGVLGVLAWAVAPTATSVWMRIWDSDAVTWLRMQLSLALTDQLWLALQLVVAATAIYLLRTLSRDLLQRRRAMLQARDNRRRSNLQAASAHERNPHGREHGGSCRHKACNRSAGTSTASTSAPAGHPLHSETWCERLGLPPLTVPELLPFLGFLLAMSMGAAWALYPAGETAAWSCISIQRLFENSKEDALAPFFLIVEIAISVAASLLGRSLLSEWNATYAAHKAKASLALRGRANSASQVAIGALARRLTENTHGTSEVDVIYDWFGTMLFGFMAGIVFASWALRPGYLPAQVVGAWPWQGPQPWVWAVGGGGAPAVCYAPGSYPVVDHSMGLPSAAGLWRGRMTAMQGQRQAVELPPLLVGELPAAAQPSRSSISDILRMDWGGCLARAARVNLLAARAWRQHGLEGVRGAMAALRALQTAGGNETAAAAALEELRRVQRPGWKAAAFTVEVSGGTTGKSAGESAKPALAAKGGSGAGSEREPQRRATRRQATQPFPATPPELQLDPAVRRQQHLTALGAAVVAATLLTTAQLRWDVAGMLLNPERLVAAVMLGVAWGLERLLWMMGASGDEGEDGGSRGRRTPGATSAKRKISGKPHAKQQQQQLQQQRPQGEAQGFGKQLQPKQQEQRPRPEVRGGQGASDGRCHQQAHGVGSGGSLQQQKKQPQQQQGVTAGGGTGQTAPAAVPSRSKQPTADSAPSGNIPRSRSLDTQGAAKGGQSAAVPCARAAGGHRANPQTRQQQVSHAPPPGAGRALSAAAAVAALFPSPAQLTGRSTCASTDVSSNSCTAATPSSNNTSSRGSSSGGGGGGSSRLTVHTDAAHNDPTSRASCSDAAVPVATALPPAARTSGSFAAAIPAAAPAQAPVPPPPAPRPAPVPVNPQAVRPATFQDIMVGRTRADPQPSSPGFFATAAATRPVVPIPIPVITAPGPAPQPRLTPRGPDGLPAAPQPGVPATAAPASAPLGFLGLKPAPAQHRMGRTAPTASTVATAGPSSTIDKENVSSWQRQGSAGTPGGDGIPTAAKFRELEASATPADPYRCIRCRTGGRQVGFLHGDSAHVCLCRGCSSALGLRDGDACPQCGVPCVRVLHVF